MLAQVLLFSYPEFIHRMVRRNGIRIQPPLPAGRETAGKGFVFAPGGKKSYI
jgi:hypothetical protein